MAWKPKWVAKESKVGDVPLSMNKENTALPEAPSPRAMPSSTATFATAVMELDAHSNSINQPKSSMSAALTTPNGFMNTVWMLSPLSFVDQSLEPLGEVDLSELSPSYREKLLILHEGTGEPIISLIQQMCQFLVEEEHAVVEEGTVKDAVEVYINCCML